FENRIGSATRIEVVTEGILTRVIQDDPLLENVGAILFDEFHERHLSGDLGLALALDVQEQLREDLRLIVMSATLDGEKLAAFLQAERISSAGRSYPVVIEYSPPARHESLPLAVRRVLQQAVQDSSGDVLVFLPGHREISGLARQLQSPPFSALDVVCLYGEMPVDQQSKALTPDATGKRRVVLATNIAESS